MKTWKFGIGHFVYDFICNRDISVMRGRRCKLTGGEMGRRPARQVYS